MASDRPAVFRHSSLEVASNGNGLAVLTPLSPASVLTFNSPLAADHRRLDKERRRKQKKSRKAAAAATNNNSSAPASNNSSNNTPTTAARRRSSGPPSALAQALAQAQAAAAHGRQIYAHTKQTRSVSIVRRSSASSRGQSSLTESHSLQSNAALLAGRADSTEY